MHTSPSSVLVPTDTTTTFKCIIYHCGYGCEVHWVINGTSTAHRHQRDHYENQGLSFFSEHNDATGVYTAKVSVRASAVLNNTRICCLIQDGIHPSAKSEQALLLVIPGNELFVH